MLQFALVIRGKWLAPAFVVACTSIAHAQSVVAVEWTWRRAHECNTTSPELRVSGVPPEAKMLQLKMVDLNFRQFDHGGGVVPVSGESSIVVPEGALKDYRGPCPTRNLHFGNDYEFSVSAVAADGKSILALGSAVRTYGRSVVKD